MSSRSKFFASILGFLCVPGIASAAYTPLIVTADFDGIRADVTTTAVGMISVLIIIVGVSLIARAFTR